VDKIAKRYSKKFKFGIFAAEDIYQEIFIMAMDALQRYDGISPLENFLVTHIKNRLILLKRDNYARASDACNQCPQFNTECEKCQRRRQTYNVKKSLSNPVDISVVNADNESSMRSGLTGIEDIECREIIEIINKQLPVKYREDYLKMRDGVYVSKPVREEIESIIKKILDEHS